ncbi:MAG: rRNA maturation RNase YbeY [Gammaproteobacteria bacterium]|nr:rRNA maturation RNase YbeY [Gammaproteobacteria bacterium]
MTSRIGVQRACEGWTVPESRSLRGWARAALAGRRTEAALTVRIVGEEEGAALNARFRGKDGPTNVLSFASEGIGAIDPAFLGDVVICAPLVIQEAREQRKALQAHWAHLVVHGVLHLLGFDHDRPGQAAQMEGLEIEILARQGFSDPYAAPSPSVNESS